MKKIIGVLFCLLLVGAMVFTALALPETRCKLMPSEPNELDDAKVVSLELVYTGTKPKGVGSVQSLAITGEHFVIAARPRGPAALGGETNNQLIIIDRDPMKDVTSDYIAKGTTYELGHANGMTYNPDKNELAVVGISNDEGDREMVVRIDASDFSVISTDKMPCYGSGVAYNARFGYYMVRSGYTLTRASDLPGIKKEEQTVETEFTIQDIGYYNGYSYLCNWVKDASCERAKNLGLQKNQNILYKVDSNGVIVQVFLLTEPREELESIDFADGEAYVLMNGIGNDSKKFFIYRVEFDSEDLK